MHKNEVGLFLLLGPPPPLLAVRAPADGQVPAVPKPTVSPVGRYGTYIRDEKFGSGGLATSFFVELCVVPYDLKRTACGNKLLPPPEKLPGLVMDPKRSLSSNSKSEIVVL